MSKEIITSFYQAFQQLDAEKMVSLYTDDVVFEDPAFGVLKGENAKNMWRMLCKNATDLKIEFKITDSSETSVTAFWEAYYTFSKTGRKVHNKIHATFIFHNGKISSHKDDFNLWSWSKQAFGLSGLLLGWSPFFRSKLQSTTNKTLLKYSVNN